MTSYAEILKARKDEEAASKPTVSVAPTNFENIKAGKLVEPNIDAQVMQEKDEEPDVSTPSMPEERYPHLLSPLPNVASGVMQFGLTMATDLTGALFGTVRAAENSIFQALDPDADVSAEDIVTIINDTRELFRVEPFTSSGEAVQGMVGDLFESTLVHAGEVMGDKTLEATGSPGLATAARMLPETIFMLAPFASRLGKDTAKNVVNSQNNKRVPVFDQATLDKYGTEVAELHKLRGLPADAINPEVVARVAELKHSTEVISKQLAQTEGMEFISVKKIDTLVNKIKPADVAKFNDLKFNDVILKTQKEGEGTAASTVVEVTIDGTNTFISKGLEEVIAAKVLGEKKLPVRTIVAKPKGKQLLKNYDKVTKASQDAIALKERLETEGTLKMGERLAKTFDITKPFKDRLKSVIPEKAWVPAVSLFEQMENAGSSAAMFARNRFEPIFTDVSNTRVLFKEKIGGKVVEMTESRILDDIVNSRMVKQISVMKDGKFKFARGLDAGHHSAYLFELKKKIGHENFDRLVGKADEMFDVYRDLLDLRHKEGLITDELHGKLREFDYSPTDFFEIFGKDSSGSLSVLETVKKRKLGTTELTNLSAKEKLSNAIYNTYVAVARNRVMQELSSVVEAHPDALVANHIKNMPKAKSKAPEGMQKVEFFKDGKKAAMAIDPFIGKAWVTPKEVTQVRASTQAIRALSGVTPVKLLAVGADFTFPLTEIPRSIMGVGLSNTVSMSGLPLFGSTSRVGNMLYGMPLAAGQMLRNMTETIREGRTHGGIFNSPHFKELAGNNGIPRFVAEIGLDEFRGLRGENLNKGAMRYLDNVVSKMSMPGVYSEALIRTAIYKQGIRRGLSKTEAANESLRFVNYNNIGTITGPMDNFSPFFAAAFNAVKSQTRGIKEAPVRANAYALSAVSTALGLYFTNWLTNKDGMQDVSDEHLATGFNIVLPKQFSYTDLEGQIRHRYFHIPADGLLSPYLAAGGMMMRKYNERREPSGMMLDGLKATFPFPQAGSVPMFDAMLAVFGNYDSFRGSKVFPKETGEPYLEYYAAHDEKATPRFLVDAGRFLWEDGAFEHDNKKYQMIPEFASIKDTGLEGLTSPERLRAAVNAYVPTHPLVALFDTVESSFDPNLFEFYNENRQLLTDMPGMRRVLKETRPATNDMNDGVAQKGPGVEAKVKAQNLADEMAFLVSEGQLKLGTAMGKAAAADGVPELYRQELMMRIFYDVQAKKIFKDQPKLASTKGVPPHKWWRFLGSTRDSKDRAIVYYNKWKAGNADARNGMNRMALRLSAADTRFNIFNQEFFREVERLKKEGGTDWEPGIFTNVAPKDAISDQPSP